MKTFNIKKFEENKGKQGYTNEYHYKLNDNSNIREFSFDDTSSKNYQREVSKEFSPFKFTYTYYENGSIYTYAGFFNKSHIGIYKIFDQNGQVIKEIDDDKNFKHSFEQIHDFVLKEKNIDIYDTRQAVALRHDTPFAPIKKYYQIHVLKSNFVDGQWYSQPNYSFLIDDETGQIVKSSKKK
ncbi:hypothetical protein [Empedobacter tilapiae]|uniref:Uncharacterized protein n=1 Tax=Empedobacter tilapiae TaxID=2491114 RepID=A0A4Z1B5D9_9FLAO|nr:hypothetical protein [Empedobacter tilapiae]TGN23114.1 hypothetical protein E4J94_15355 [Empedobacter tilapiae]